MSFHGRNKSLLKIDMYGRKYLEVSVWFVLLVSKEFFYTINVSFRLEIDRNFQNVPICVPRRPLYRSDGIF